MIDVPDFESVTQFRNANCCGIEQIICLGRHAYRLTRTSVNRLNDVLAKSDIPMSVQLNSCLRGNRD